MHFNSFFFFFNDTATTEIYTLSLHDALPISSSSCPPVRPSICPPRFPTRHRRRSLPPVRSSSAPTPRTVRSEEHTSELQSRPHLVCRLLLEKKKKNTTARPRALSSKVANTTN